MVSGQQIQVWQSDGVLYIKSRYQDDPRFTLEQEKALYEIAENMLIVNRLRERRKRYNEKRKKERQEDEQEAERLRHPARGVGGRERVRDGEMAEEAE